MARCSHMLWKAGRNAEAHALAGGRCPAGKPLPPGPALAQAQAAMARLLMLGRDMPGAIVLGSTAIESPGSSATSEPWPRAQLGGQRHWLTDPDRAVELLTPGLAPARRGGDDLAPAAVLSILGTGAGETRRYEQADRG